MSNLTPTQHTALEGLAGNKSIVIKPVDKGGNTVVINNQDYKQIRYVYRFSPALTLPGMDQSHLCMLLCVYKHWLAQWAWPGNSSITHIHEFRHSTPSQRYTSSWLTLQVGPLFLATLALLRMPVNGSIVFSDPLLSVYLLISKILLTSSNLLKVS